MSILAAVASGIGLVQGLGNNARAQGMSSEALAQMRANQRLQEEERARLEEVRRVLLAQGFGNADAQIAASRANYAANQAIGLGNLGAFYRTAGHQPGDSPGKVAARGLTTRGLAQQAMVEQQYAQQAMAQRMSLEQLGGPNGVMAANAGYANALQNGAQTMRTDYGGLMAGLGQMNFGGNGAPSMQAVQANPYQYAQPAGPQDMRKYAKMYEGFGLF